MKIKVDCPITPDDLIALSANQLTVSRVTINERLSRPGVRSNTKHGKLPKSEIGNSITHTREAAARGISLRSLRRMKMVERKGIPALINAVADGTIKVSKAEEIATLPQNQQQEALDLHLTRQQERAEGRECNPRNLKAKDWAKEVNQWYRDTVQPEIRKLYENLDTPEFVKKWLEKLNSCLLRGLSF